MNAERAAKRAAKLAKRDAKPTAENTPPLATTAARFGGLPFAMGIPMVMPTPVEMPNFARAASNILDAGIDAD